MFLIIGWSYFQWRSALFDFDQSEAISSRQRDEDQSCRSCKHSTRQLCVEQRSLYSRSSRPRLISRSNWPWWWQWSDGRRWTVPRWICRESLLRRQRRCSKRRTISSNELCVSSSSAAMITRVHCWPSWSRCLTRFFSSNSTRYSKTVCPSHSTYLQRTDSNGSESDRWRLLGKVTDRHRIGKGLFQQIQELLFDWIGVFVRILVVHWRKEKSFLSSFLRLKIIRNRRTIHWWSNRHRYDI